MRLAISAISVRLSAKMKAVTLRLRPVVVIRMRASTNGYRGYLHHANATAIISVYHRHFSPPFSASTNFHFCLLLFIRRRCAGFLPGSCHIRSQKMAMVCSAQHPVYCQYLGAPMWGLGCARSRLCDELCQKAERLGGTCTASSQNLTATVECDSMPTRATVLGKNIKFPFASSYRGAAIHCHHKLLLQMDLQ